MHPECWKLIEVDGKLIVTNCNIKDWGTVAFDDTPENRQRLQTLVDWHNDFVLQD